MKCQLFHMPTYMTATLALRVFSRPIAYRSYITMYLTWICHYAVSLDYCGIWFRPVYLRIIAIYEYLWDDRCLFENDRVTLHILATVSLVNFNENITMFRKFVAQDATWTFRSIDNKSTGNFDGLRYLSDVTPLKQWTLFQVEFAQFLDLYCVLLKVWKTLLALYIVRY